MIVIIYRKYRADVEKVFYQLSEGFKKLKISEESMAADNKKKTIDLNEWHFDFFCGNIYKMAGIRPSFYNTDDRDASRFLEQSASKIGGQEIQDVNDLFNILKSMYGVKRFEQIVI